MTKSLTMESDEYQFLQNHHLKYDGLLYIENDSTSSSSCGMLMNFEEEDINLGVILVLRKFFHLAFWICVYQERGFFSHSLGVGYERVDVAPRMWVGKRLDFTNPVHHERYSLVSEAIDPK
ncbi:hypothetical protein NPIL_512931 [Nephila pilipes]|uniref:Uncharacterized protein n=1 Tax=Nephila pilipes TaxID=299642 RepID=A0A8X6QPW4_NEPPI|nr:hypothetical protein NPIL_512931 [Nephila pilipes]